MPHLGENAIYKMARFLLSLEQHNEKIYEDPFLGKGTVVASIAEDLIVHLGVIVKIETRSSSE